MKKIIIFLFLFMIISISYNEKNNIMIPKDSIRFRVIANSNSKNDQKLKMSVKNELEQELYTLISDANNIEEARNIIKSNIKEVDIILKKYNIDYEINYGSNYFPEKTFKGLTYKEGNYESLVIKLGNAMGKNWWCVLFPPLCMLDQNENLSDAEYKFFAENLINKIK